MTARRATAAGLARSLWPLLVVVAGVAVMLCAFVYGGYHVNVPYPDPTPEQAARQAHHELVFERMLIVGFATTIVGVLAAVLAWAPRRARRRRTAGAASPHP